MRRRRIKHLLRMHWLGDTRILADRLIGIAEYNFTMSGQYVNSINQALGQLSHYPSS